MKIHDLEAHFRSAGDWVNWDDTVDGVKAGDPDREIQKIAVAWNPTWDALKEAHARGADLFISHESVAVRGNKGLEEPSALPTEKPKFEWLRETGIVVWRCHDFWDIYPEEGIRASWHRGLRLEGRIIAEDRVLVTEIEPRPAIELARHVLRCIKPLGQEGVLLTGPHDQMVSRIATGYGVTHDIPHMVKLGADVGVVTDDYFLHVRMGAHARELNFPTIGVNHGVSEEWGIQNLARYIAQTFPNVSVFHIPQKCPYDLITG